MVEQPQVDGGGVHIVGEQLDRRPRFGFRGVVVRRVLELVTATEVSSVEDQIEVALPARVDQQCRAVRVRLVGDLVQGIAAVLEAECDLVAEALEPGLYVTLDIGQVLGGSCDVVVGA